jgi:hypothetical protein
MYRNRLDDHEQRLVTLEGLGRDQNTSDQDGYRHPALAGDGKCVYTPIVNSLSSD